MKFKEQFRARRALVIDNTSIPLVQFCEATEYVDTYEEAVEDGKYSCHWQRYGGDWDAFTIEKVFVAQKDLDEDEDLDA